MTRKRYSEMGIPGVLRQIERDPASTSSVVTVVYTTSIGDGKFHKYWSA